ncbi:hypothetical protein Taro_001084 [Colocasia esculenta]|uniref:CCHC-type domain-containing protein n=1 Tax=Colocasia esculenta TaxID=4460 RepID=A0A843TF54_COLES|nr:hypothetical protein [Colocasia esculenta]
MGLKPSLRTRLVAFDHRTLDEALSAACRQEGEMEQYLEEKKASQKRPSATFQRQDKKKVVYQTPQRSVAVGSSQVPSVRSSGVKKECPHCGKTHGGTECWMITGKCLKCGSSDHKIKDCPRLQQGVQRGAPAPAGAKARVSKGVKHGLQRGGGLQRGVGCCPQLFGLCSVVVELQLDLSSVAARLRGVYRFCHGSVDTPIDGVDTGSESLKVFHEDRVKCVDTAPGSVDTSPRFQKTQLPDWDSVSTQPVYTDFVMIVSTHPLMGQVCRHSPW